MTTHRVYDLDEMPRQTQATPTTELVIPSPAAKLAALRAAERSTRRIRHERRLIAQQVAIARRHGASWVEVGHALGVSRQAARQHFEGNRSEAEGGSSDR